ncbi:Uncharacterised protein [uncultured archaeon]|nr:Uncharacterised protein [uncultured archaeon]
MSVELEFLSSDVLSNMTEEEKMGYILEHVKKNKILVVEESLTHVEESRLIEATMKEVSKKFPGIEVSTLRERGAFGIRERLIKMLGGTTGGLTVIGPSKLIRDIKKEPQKISMLALSESDEEDKKKR